MQADPLVYRRCARSEVEGETLSSILELTLWDGEHLVATLTHCRQVGFVKRQSVC